MLSRPTLRRACFLASRHLTTTATSGNGLNDRTAQAASISPHKKKATPAQDSFLTASGPASTTPVPIHGDWVLFHPVYSPEELKSVEVLHQECKTFADKLAFRLVKLCRFGFDIISGYKHKTIPPNSNMSIQELRKDGYLLDEKQWLARILFLETIAGVPGMVAATVRHLISLRLMKRDNGWIHTCLEEAENERMHLMTFMTLREPALWFRALILGAQGVFYNLFFLMYLVNPSSCHRFVGYLEEEATITYTKAIAEMEKGLIPEWTNKPAPQIAIDYWRLRQDATLLDVLYAVRAGKLLSQYESTHRFVNHSFANLNTKTDANPFCLREPDMQTKGQKISFDRSESEDWVKGSHELLKQQEKKAQASMNTS